jgi:hypothetical protein
MTEPTTGFELRLTPTGHLRLDQPDTTCEKHDGLKAVFQSDWREGLFMLAAEKIQMEGRPAHRYWKEFAQRYLNL